MAELARRNNLVIFADEIYDKLILDDAGRATEKRQPSLHRRHCAGCAGRHFRRTIEELSGARAGASDGALSAATRHAVKPYVEGIHRLLRARLCANHPEQYAIKAALEGPQDHLIETRNKLRARRDLTVQWCNSTPRVSCVSPRGAFYAFPRLDITEGDDVFVKELCRKSTCWWFTAPGSGKSPVPATSVSCSCPTNPRSPRPTSQWQNSSPKDTNNSSQKCGRGRPRSCGSITNAARTVALPHERDARAHI